jgi:hypothetical protein
MCGIVGYVGRQEAAPLLIEGLRRLEFTWAANKLPRRLGRRAQA